MKLMTKAIHGILTKKWINVNKWKLNEQKTNDEFELENQCVSIEKYWIINENALSSK
jgi:hypothetical protein